MVAVWHSSGASAHVHGAPAGILRLRPPVSAQRQRIYATDSSERPTLSFCASLNARTL